MSGRTNTAGSPGSAATPPHARGCSTRNCLIEVVSGDSPPANRDDTRSACIRSATAGEASASDRRCFSPGTAVVLPAYWYGGSLFETARFSYVTYTTMCYGFLCPNGRGAELLATGEAYLGTVLSALLIYALVTRLEP